jgi:Tol biopolymer transport system component
MVGSSILHYRILEKLGEGGMGVVYKARDTRLDRTVAVKVLPPELVADPDRKGRFIQEAKAASALNHPGIITIHDIVSDEAGECIVMEHVDGHPLSQLIEGKELRLADILKIAAQIADAVASAHAAGIIHRDLKPSNIMVTESGLVKVLDFGLAKLVTRLPGPAGVTMTMPRTDPGMVIGTLGYMSPEQLRGQELDRRTDIFNFGLILYEMLAGARAFPGNTSVDVMSAILKESPAELPETVPAALRQIVAVCLEKNPANRFDSARDIGFALRALTAGASITATMPKSEEEGRKSLWRLALPFALAAASIVAAIFAVLYFLRRPETLDLSAYKFTPFATDAQTEMSGIWSPDGKSIAYLKSLGPWNQLMWRSLEAPAPTPLTRLPMGVFANCFWSPDGSRVFFISRDSRSLLSIGIAGGEPELVLRPYITAATLSPDGKSLVLWMRPQQEGSELTSLWISSPPGSPPRRYEPVLFDEDIRSLPVYLQFSPDGRRIILSLRTKSEVEIWCLDWPDGPKAKTHRVFKQLSLLTVPSFSWMPDSRHLVLSIDRNLWQADIKTGSLKQITMSTGPSYYYPSISPDGSRIVVDVSSSDYDIVSIPLDGSSPQRLVATSQREYSPSWSQDGGRMAFVTFRSGEPEIWLRSRDGEWERPIVTQKDFPGDRVSFGCVAISPNGKSVAYHCSGTKTGHKIWISPAAGGKPVRADPGTDQEEFGLTWAPDGSSIAYFAVKGGSMHLDRIRIGGQNPPELIPGTEGRVVGAPAWSPDGQWIAWGNPFEQAIVLVSSDGRESRTLPSPVKIGGYAFFLAWSRDSSTIYAASSLEEESTLFEIAVKTGKCRKLADWGAEISFSVPYLHCLSGSLSGDGKSLATSVIVEKSDLWILEGFPQPGRRQR